MDPKQSTEMFSMHAKPGSFLGVAKLSDQVSVRIDPEWRETLRSIEEKHRIPPPEFIRGLVAAGLEFYRTQGWFAFPVSVEPIESYVQAVAETQNHYKTARQPVAPGPQDGPSSDR